VIVGGGPAGVACALLLQRLAWEANRRVQLTILEGKQFSGARHHNLCSGVLTPPLPALLERRLQVLFPTDLNNREIVGYILHSAHEQVLLDEVETSVALRRVQFDNYMLECARKRGLSVIPARAVDLDFHSDRVVVYTESAPLEADVVVGAFGMDEGTAAVFARATGYRAPDALTSIVTRFHPGPEAMAAFGPRIHAFLSSPGIEFGAVTPKDDHVTINIAGGNVTDEQMAAFLSRPEVRAVLPGSTRVSSGPAGGLDPTDFHAFKGRFPCSLAGRYYGDRYVLVGDAAGLVRAFKGKGVTSAVTTGIRAAEAIFHAGVSEAAFRDHYARANQDITGDQLYGQSMRQLVRASIRLGLIDPVLRAARESPALREALLGAVSGHLPYREVYRDMLRPDAVVAMLRAMTRRAPRKPDPGSQLA
jgi:flavin-dependent dehydrogenase